jgi:hypothetical protein
MASFFGHLYGGAAVSAGAALAVEGLKWAPPDRVPLLFALGVAGGLLPDIDSDGSTPVRVFFTLLGVMAAFLTCFWLIEDYSVQVLALVWAGVFLFVRFGVFEVFSRLTVHRGIWHSWLAAAFAGLALVDAVYHFGGFSPWESWLAGFFLALGYLTHLCLDEIASFDLLGTRVKRSFGTALKPFSIATPFASVAMLLGVLVLAHQAPTLEPVVAAAGRVRAEYLSTPLWGLQGHKKSQAGLL